MTAVPPRCPVERARQHPVEPPKPALSAPITDEEPCVMCGSDAVTWRKCKLICERCGTIIKSCADL